VIARQLEADRRGGDDVQPQRTEVDARRRDAGDTLAYDDARALGLGNPLEGERLDEGRGRDSPRADRS
jgi:hypothetical protein